MPCAFLHPCGNRLRPVAFGVGFVVYECWMGHPFRVPPITSPPPVSKHDVLASATKDIQDPGAWKQKLMAQGRCVRCKRLRGVKGTQSHCRKCADAMNRVSLKWQKKTGYARRRAATQATKDEHARQMGGIKRKEKTG